jgi:co-chaperonin GroES (HSP10)
MQIQRWKVHSEAGSGIILSHRRSTEENSGIVVTMEQGKWYQKVLPSINVTEPPDEARKL